MNAPLDLPAPALVRALVAVLLGASLLLAGCRREDPGRATPRGDAGAVRARELLALRSLPYLSSNPVAATDRKKRGVVLHDRRRAFEGVSFYNSRPRSEAMLIDMDGRVLHRWSSRAGQPSALELAWSKRFTGLDLEGWHHSELLPDGDVLALVNGHAVLRLDPDSRVLWIAPVAAHHDLAVGADGDLYVLSMAKRLVRRGLLSLPLLDNEVVVLSADSGAIERRISLLDVLGRSPSTQKPLESLVRIVYRLVETHYREVFTAGTILGGAKDVEELIPLYESIAKGAFAHGPRLELALMVMMPGMDLLHANSLEILDRDVAGLGQRGDLLLSLRNLDLVLVVDPRRAVVRWSFGPGVLERQHHPSILENGHLLVFDNHPTAGASRVLEIDPATSKIVWEYKGRPPPSFFSHMRGDAQRLPNGNVLVTDSERGRAFEVTRSGETVWEFFNPDTDDPYLARERAPIYRMRRFSREAFARWRGAGSPDGGPARDRKERAP
jgi:hypothetical protein